LTSGADNKNLNLLVLETSSAILNCSNLSCPASLIALCLLPFKISTIWLIVVDLNCLVICSTNERICFANIVKSTNFVWATLQQLSQRVSICFLHWLDKYCSPKYSSNNVRRQSTLLRQ